MTKIKELWTISTGHAESIKLSQVVPKRNHTHILDDLSDVVKLKMRGDAFMPTINLNDMKEDLANCGHVEGKGLRAYLLQVLNGEEELADIFIITPIALNNGRDNSLTLRNAIVNKLRNEGRSPTYTAMRDLTLCDDRHLNLVKLAGKIVVKMDMYQGSYKDSINRYYPFIRGLDIMSAPLLSTGEIFKGDTSMVYEDSSYQKLDMVTPPTYHNPDTVH